MMEVTSKEKMEQLVLQWGFAPFFANHIEGFSIEEHTPEGMLFNDTPMGNAWEWKGPVIGNWRCAYGKFYQRKAGYVALEWLPDFMNWRRHAHPIASIGEDAQHILTTLRDCESALSRELKKMSGFSLARRRTRKDAKNPFVEIRQEHNGADFDRLIAEMQMGTWVCIADFEYKYTKSGERYGWGVARYCTPEAMYGDDWASSLNGRSPSESLDRMMEHLHKLIPSASEKDLVKLLQ